MSDFEEEYFRHDRKEEKRFRKEISKRDRSKYKKTDKAKYFEALAKEKDEKLSKEGLIEGRVLSITPQGMAVESAGEQFNCVLKGLLKRELTQVKNLVTVGDFVLFEKSSEGEGVIVHIKPRHSVLSRADNLSRRKEQFIAANIDQVLITVSVVNPPLKPPLVDRYIIATRKGGMEPIIVVNKIDLFDDTTQDPSFIAGEKELFTMFLDAYAKAGVPVIPVSIKNLEGIQKLHAVMRNKSSVFSGQSGVGKSSLINVVTGLDLKTGEVVERTRKGSHTTTTAQLIPLDGGGWCIDTPGIRSFGVWDLRKDELESYYDEIHECGKQCKFPDCTHTHEEDCAVLQAVERGEISPMRYHSYAALLQSIQQEHLRR